MKTKTVIEKDEIKENQNGKFRINGWGILVIDTANWECGREKGFAFNMKGDAGGVMPYTEMERMVTFLRKKLKEVEMTASQLRKRA